VIDKEPLSPLGFPALDAKITLPLGPELLDPLIKDSIPPGPVNDLPPSTKTGPPEDDPNAPSPPDIDTAPPFPPPNDIPAERVTEPPELIPELCPADNKIDPPSLSVPDPPNISVSPPSRPEPLINETLPPFPVLASPARKLEEEPRLVVPDPAEIIIDPEEPNELEPVSRIISPVEDVLEEPVIREIKPVCSFVEAIFILSPDNFTDPPDFEGLKPAFKIRDPAMEPDPASK
jgi:hypothetical protein